MNHPAEPRRQFASDNLAGICPEAWTALARANQSHSPSYGDDPWTRQASTLIQELFETDCAVFFVFNGTAANSLALSTLCQSYHGILCHQSAHIETDECGAPEFFSNGAKILPLPGPDGKLDPAVISSRARRRADVHFPKPRALSLTQATESGTVYSLDELNAISAAARELGLKIHMDGARFANALAHLDLPPKSITWEAGVDVLCLGGTKNGAHCGEAVVFFDRELAADFEFRRKQAGQLCSKMRFLSAPWVAMLENGAWLRHARHANQMAELLRQSLLQFPEITIQFPRQANSVFAAIPRPVVQALHQRGWIFHTLAGQSASRLMCSWDTTPDDIRHFISDLGLLIEH